MSNSVMDGLKSPLARQFAGALRRNEFTLAYQPILSLPDRKLERTEALLRWNRYPRMNPSAFLPFADADPEQAVALHMRTFDRVCEANADWHRFKVPTRLHTDLHARQLNDMNVAAQLLRRVHDHGLEAEAITLEIPSEWFAGGLQASALTSLRDAGFTLALDHVDARPSPEVPAEAFSFLKLDPRLTLAVLDKAARQTLDTIRAYAQERDLRVVAAGVQTGEQEEVLVEEGVEFAQGLLYRRPATQLEYTRYLKESTTTTSP